MKTLLILTKRNSKLFFKDKGMFFSSLITPAILLVLYVTFLSNVYRDSFLSALPEGFSLSDSIIDGVVGGQLASSLLAVCCVTIAFCSNLLMIQDKVTGSVRDLTVTPLSAACLQWATLPRPLSSRSSCALSPAAYALHTLPRSADGF